MTVSRLELPRSKARGFESEDLPPRSREGSPFVARDVRCLGPLTVGFYAATAIAQTNPQSSRASATTAVWRDLPRPTKRTYLL